MKKALKITGIILSVAFMLFILMEIFIPGLPLYIKLKIGFPKIDEKINTYQYSDVKVPDSFIKVRMGGYRVRVPSDTDIDGKRSFIKSEALYLNVMEDALSMFSDNSITYNASNGYNYDKEEYINFFDTIDYPQPIDTKEMRIFVNDKLELKTCLHLRGTDRKIFEEFAESKKIVLDVETKEYFSHNNIDGFVCKINNKKFNENKYKYYWNIDIFRDDQEDIIMLLANDEDLIKQIIASVEYIG